MESKKITEQGLIQITSNNIIDALKTNNGMVRFVEDLKVAQESFVHDLSTAAGRKKTASFARKFSSVKKKVDDIGKQEVAGIKARAKAIDSNRKYFRDELDLLRDKARAPLTEWEEKEDARIHKHMDAIKKMEMDLHPGSAADAQDLADIQSQIANGEYPPSLEEMKATLDHYASLTSSHLKEFEEFEDQASKTLIDGIEVLRGVIKIEEEKIEKEKQERIEREEQERKQKEMEEELAKIRAEKEALEKEKREKEAEERHKRELEEAIEREEQERKQKELAVKEAEERIKEAEKRAEKERIEAEERTKQEVEAARIKEIDRQKAEQRRIDEERIEREANEKHVKEINDKACLALSSIKGITLDKASIIVQAIKNGEIPNVFIKY